MKRFYTDAAAARGDDGWQVTLDGRPVRTPGRAPLYLPTGALAEAIAREWAAQGKTVEPAAMPLTGFSYAAIDRVAPDRLAFAACLARFAETELMCYRAEGPAPLVAQQAEIWDPQLEWARLRYDVGFTVTRGIVHAAQPPMTLVRIGATYAAFDAFRLAALNAVVTICGSAVIGLAVAEHQLDGAAAFAAGQLDELWQADQWGNDPLAAASLAGRRAAVDCAVRFLTLLEVRGASC